MNLRELTLARELSVSQATVREALHRLEALEAAVEADRYYEAAQADLEFHRWVWQCSGSETLCRHLELLVIPLFALISILRCQGLERLVTVVEAHRPLLSVLRSGDPEQIRQAFTRGATSAYHIFLGDGPECAALGYLSPAAR